MDEIQRYSLQWEWMKEDKEGEYVKYEDFRKIMNELRQELTEARWRLILKST